MVTAPEAVPQLNQIRHGMGAGAGVGVGVGVGVTSGREVSECAGVLATNIVTKIAATANSQILLTFSSQ